VIRVFLAFGDVTSGDWLFDYLNEQPDFQACGKAESRGEVVRGAIRTAPRYRDTGMAAENDLEVADACKQRVPSLPLLLVAGRSKRDRKEGPAWMRLSKGR
jgi:hypothetical protein